MPDLCNNEYNVAVLVHQLVVGLAEPDLGAGRVPKVNT